MDKAPDRSGDTAVQAQNLHKRYDEFTAVRDVSFTVLRGEVFGLLGPNGAGKTTTIGMLTGRRRPTSGRALIEGVDPALHRASVRPSINLVSHEQNVYERLSGRENLRFYARLYGLRAAVADEAIDRLGLAEHADRKAREYSAGMRQRLMLGRALLNAPRVLFLDEPTRGLDPASRLELHGRVRDLAVGGTTIVLTTHDMAEADELCDRVAFIDRGELVALDTPRALKLASTAPRRAIVDVRGGGQRELSLEGIEGAQLGELLAAGLVETIHSTEPTLADVFIELTQATSPDSAAV